MDALGHVLRGWAISAVANGYWGSKSDQYIGKYDLSDARISLPDARIAVLGQPNSSYPTAVSVAFGVQNYTCSVNNNFT